MEYMTLKKAIKEAERFLEKAKMVKICKSTITGKEIIDYNHVKDSAAVKRASMDLTRTLTDLRQNR